MATGATCPNCGGPLEFDTGHAAVVVCSYCNSAIRVAEGPLEVDTSLAPLAPMPSRFALDRRVTILGTPCTVVGQARYEYEDGLWDEWNLVHDTGEHSWITEDEGDLIWFRHKERVQAPWPSSPRPGGVVTVAGRRVSIREIGQAYVVGARGQLTMIPEWGVDIDYIDGVGDGKVVVLMRYLGGILLCEGQPLRHSDILVSST